MGQAVSNLCRLLVSPGLLHRLLVGTSFRRRPSSLDILLCVYSNRPKGAQRISQALSPGKAYGKKIALKGRPTSGRCFQGDSVVRVVPRLRMLRCCVAASAGRAQATPIVRRQDLISKSHSRALPRRFNSRSPVQPTAILDSTEVSLDPIVNHGENCATLATTGPRIR